MWFVIGDSSHNVRASLDDSKYPQQKDIVESGLHGETLTWMYIDEVSTLGEVINKDFIRHDHRLVDNEGDPKYTVTYNGTLEQWEYDPKLGWVAAEEEP